MEEKIKVNEQLVEQSIFFQNLYALNISETNSFKLSIAKKIIIFLIFILIFLFIFLFKLIIIFDKFNFQNIQNNLNDEKSGGLANLVSIIPNQSIKQETCLKNCIFNYQSFREEYLETIDNSKTIIQYQTFSDQFNSIAKDFFSSDLSFTSRLLIVIDVVLRIYSLFLYY